MTEAGQLFQAGLRIAGRTPLEARNKGHKVSASRPAQPRSLVLKPAGAPHSHTRSATVSCHGFRHSLLQPAATRAILYTRAHVCPRTALTLYLASKAAIRGS